MNTQKNQQLEAESPLPYEMPGFKRHRLDLVTLGGPSGGGDSGATDSEDLLGFAAEKEEGWDDEGDGNW